MTAESKRIGLWQRESKKGEEYLGGADKDSNVRFMVFKDKENPEVRRLTKKPLDDNEAPLETVATLTKSTDKDDNVFFRADGYLIFSNNYYEEGSTQPQYNLVIKA